ncbi:carbon-nitrogen hydrolase family protein [Streptomyces sp. 7N604]|uniref:carbon-nitrogen hydrolase family protein n=1 Tax=Streptomyces sp. 7N604 TaxID=3457415 RepID=UPI003FD3A36C
MSQQSKASTRLGLLQPKLEAGDRAPMMVDNLERHIAEAAKLGIDLLVCPELYPGPVTWHTRYDVVERIQRAAQRHGVDVVMGTTEKADVDDEQAYHIVCVVISRHGEIIGRYYRHRPDSDYYYGLYALGPHWQFTYVAYDYGEDELPVFDMGDYKLGIAICSEIFVPKIASELADNGAELIVNPTGILIDDLGFTENWHTMVRQAAISKNAYSGTTMGLMDGALREAHVKTGLKPVDPATGLNRGHAMIASPEYILGTMTGPGILTANLDFDYIRGMRSSPEFPNGIHSLPPPYASLPGLHNLS